LAYGLCLRPRDREPGHKCLTIVDDATHDAVAIELERAISGQRLIRFDPHQAALARLRPGLSSTVTVRLETMRTEEALR
jgi:hypothetical protein